MFSRSLPSSILHMVKVVDWKALCESPGLHSQMHGEMGLQGAVSGNLLLDGPLKGLDHLFALIVSPCGILMLS